MQIAHAINETSPVGVITALRTCVFDLQMKDAEPPFEARVHPNTLKRLLDQIALLSLETKPATNLADLTICRCHVRGDDSYADENTITVTSETETEN